jgi:hypothetical protein
MVDQLREIDGTAHYGGRDLKATYEYVVGLMLIHVLGGGQMTILHSCAPCVHVSQSALLAHNASHVSSFKVKPELFFVQDEASEVVNMCRRTHFWHCTLAFNTLPP